jgi:hypothetical protein
MPRRLSIAAAAVAVLLLGAPAAHAAPPKILSVSPLKVKVGQVLTLRGTGFIPGKLKNTVVFQRDRARAVFVKADSASSTRIRVRIPAKLAAFLTNKGGVLSATRFRLRVLARSFGLAYTARRLSPLVAPSTTSTPSGVPGCDDSSTSATKDSDGDLLSDAVEAKIKTDPCRADSDGDGIEDGYEYESALDLNSRAIPYPGKKPYPNPLYAGDALIDFDGDGLSQGVEYTMWQRYGGHKFPLNYSDGAQDSNGPAAIPVGENWLDLDGNGTLSDDERDVDSDGLSNWVEVSGPMTPAWWLKAFQNEKPYTVQYEATDYLDPDTDGDGVLDGFDDQDHDDVINIGEFNRELVHQFVNPFNPCLPNPLSRTCSRHPPPPKESYPPFNGYVLTPVPLPWPIADPTTSG